MQPLQKVTVSVPATTANLGPGFDALGLALELRNEFEFVVLGEDTNPEIGLGGGVEAPRQIRGSVTVEVLGEGAGSLPRDGTNLAVRAACAVFEKAGLTPPIMAARLRNRVPLGRGLGSSATAIVGGVLAGNHLLGGALSEREIVSLCTEIEGHPDNVTPAFAGGFVASMKSDDGVRFVRLPFPLELRVVVAVPDFELSTEKARRALPGQIPFGDAVFNLGRTAILVGAMATGALELLRHGTEDRLHQPYRKHLVPGLLAVIQAARRAGAFGAALSGAGPSVVAFVTGESQEAVAHSMVQAFCESGVRAEGLLLAPARQGANVTLQGAG